MARYSEDEKDAMSFRLDSAIAAALEKGDRILGVRRHGNSDWASTRRIDAQGTGGEHHSYFLKTLSGKDTAERVNGEFRSMCEIYNTLPAIAPKPRGYGECQEKGKYFFVCDFLNISHDLPDPVRLGKTLSELHLKSQSPNGKFGFYCTTFDGEKPLNTTWDENWTRFFSRLINDVYQQEKDINGHWKPLEDAMQIAVEQLIPRLLDPLTAHGLTIKPCLIHGDLWESNIGTDNVTGEIYIYDACCYYAHHEKEIAIWRVAHHKMTDDKYRNEYFKHFPLSEPIEEADDRSRLYAVETLLINSLSFPGAETRKLAYEELRALIEKYIPGSSRLHLGESEAAESELQLPAPHP
ncbi:Fructosamine/Ketosamine-3-kinase [Xylariaceae sp. FL0255]|nr:Fructosamine/Ketosamine-3-kinase [Xylariaceae sp. FL0255]